MRERRATQRIERNMMDNFERALCRNDWGWPVRFGLYLGEYSDMIKMRYLGFYASRFTKSIHFSSFSELMKMNEWMPSFFNLSESSRSADRCFFVKIHRKQVSSQNRYTTYSPSLKQAFHFSIVAITDRHILFALLPKIHKLPILEQKDETTFI